MLEGASTIRQTHKKQAWNQAPSQAEEPLQVAAKPAGGAGACNGAPRLAVLAALAAAAVILFCAACAGGAGCGAVAAIASARRLMPSAAEVASSLPVPLGATQRNALSESSSTTAEKPGRAPTGPESAAAEFAVRIAAAEARLSALRAVLEAPKRGMGGAGAAAARQ